MSEAEDKILALLERLEDVVLDLKAEYADELATFVKEAGWKCSEDIEIYDSILELKNGKTVLSNLECAGFDPFSLCEQVINLE